MFISVIFFLNTSPEFLFNDLAMAVLLLFHCEIVYNTLVKNYPKKIWKKFKYFSLKLRMFQTKCSSWILDKNNRYKLGEEDKKAHTSNGLLKYIKCLLRGRLGIQRARLCYLFLNRQEYQAIAASWHLHFCCILRKDVQQSSPLYLIGHFQPPPCQCSTCKAIK